MTNISLNTVMGGLEDMFGWICYMQPPTRCKLLGEAAPGDSQSAGNSPRKTISPHLWLRYFLPRLESDVAKTAAEKKMKKNPIFQK